MRCRREATQKFRTAISMQLEWIIVGFAIIISYGSSSSSSSTCTTASSSPAPNTTTHSNKNKNNSSLPTAAADLDNRDIMRLWAAVLRAINKAELQRLDNGHAPSAAHAPNYQRLNSKRMKWRPNSKLLDRRSEFELAPFAGAAAAEERSGTYTSTEEDNHNPTYIDVRDNEPQPSPWWF